MSLNLYRDAFDHHPLNSDHYQKITLRRYRLTNTHIELSEEDEKLIEEVSTALSKPSGFDRKLFMGFSIESILTYLGNTHTLYLNKYLPEILQSIRNLRQLAEGDSKFLEALEILFSGFRKDLIWHIQQEETELFPYVRYLMASQSKEIPIDLFSEKLRDYNLSAFIHEHSEGEIDLKVIRKTLGNYEPDDSTRSLYRVLFTQLINLEMDLIVHAKIEEEVLIPKALEIKK